MGMRSKFALFGLLTTGALIVSLAPRAVADGIDPLDVNRRRTADPLSNQASPASDPFFDMMHRVQLGNIRSLPEYSRDQQENIGSQASEFRNRQRQIMQQQSSPTAVPTSTQSDSQPGSLQPSTPRTP